MTKIANTEREEATCCKECNMWVKPNEFHPFAACLMFKHCRNSDMVRANLAFVQNKGFEEGQARAEQDFGMTSNTEVNLKDMLAKCKKLGIHYYGNGKTLSGDECLALIKEFTTPQPVFTHPPITLTREKIKEIVSKSFLVWLDSEKTSIEVVADLIVAELSK